MEGMKQMEKPVTGSGLIKSFCRAWFALRDPVAAVAFLTDDVCFTGTGRNESACGKQQMAEYLKQDIREISEPFSIEYRNAVSYTHL